MTYISSIPSPPLNAYILDLYYLDGPAAYPRQKVLPVASVNVMINLGNPFNVYEPDQARPFVSCTDSWLVGVWNTYHSVDWPPNVRLFGVHFKPGGAYPLVGLPLSEMNRQVVPLSALWGRGAGEIRERLHAAPTIQAGFALLEQLLLTRLCEAPYRLGVVQHAITEIDHRHGALSIRAMSDQNGFSRTVIRQVNRACRVFHVNCGRKAMTLQRMDNVLIVVDGLAAAKAFFVELGMELEGETTVEGPSVDRLIGLQNVRATLALMRTPDGHGRIELDKFHTPQAIRTGPENVPVNALGIRRIMFAVDDIDDVVARLRAHGAELVGDVVQYEDTYRLCYIRGPEGIIVGLAEQLG